MLSKHKTAAVCLIGLTLTVWAASAVALDNRQSAQIAARWAVEARNPQALADSLSVLLKEGSTLDREDPFSVSHLADELAVMPGGPDLLEAVLASNSRGQLGGAARLDLELAPGEAHEVEVVLVGRELTWVEARLWRGSEGADIDVVLTGTDGTGLAADTQPQTGVEGIAALLDVWVETCTRARLRITNAGTAAGRVALFVPQTTRPNCEAPG